MKYLVLLAMMIYSGSIYALQIDEAGTQRVKKPAIEISLEVENVQGLTGDFKDLIDSAAQNDNTSVVIEIDLDGDGEMERMSLHGDPHEYIDGRKGLKFTKIKKETSAQSELRESKSVLACCSGMATGRRQHLSLQLSQSGVDGANGGMVFNEVEEMAVAGRRAGRVKYKNIVLKLENLDSDSAGQLLRKGWDGTVKGSGTKGREMMISIVSGDGKNLGQIKLKIKDGGEVKSCSGFICGKTDHL